MPGKRLLQRKVKGGESPTMPAAAMVVTEETTTSAVLTYLVERSSPQLSPVTRRGPDSPVRKASPLPASIMKLNQLPNLYDDVSMFHECQQSGRMIEDYRRRHRMAYELRHQAGERLGNSGNSPEKAFRVKDYSAQMPMPKPDAVTLCLELGVPRHFYYLDWVYDASKGDGAKRRDGENLANIATETKTCLSMPDRASSETSFMNPHDELTGQVTITGRIEDVEQARIRLRNMAPICIAGQLPDDAVARMTTWMTESREKGLLKKLRHIVHAAIEECPQSNNTKCMLYRVMARAKDEVDLVRVCEEFMKEIHGSDADKATVWSELEIARKLADLICQPEGTLKYIANATQVVFHLPSSLNPSASTFCCAGNTPSAVLDARRLILAMLPIQLCFDAADNQLRQPLKRAPEEQICAVVDGVTVRVMKSDYESAKPLDNEIPRHFFNLTASEMHLSNIYALRRRFFDRSTVSSRGSQQSRYAAASTDSSPVVFNTTKVCDVFKVSSENVAALTAMLEPMYPDCRVLPRKSLSDEPDVMCSCPECQVDSFNNSYANAVKQSAASHLAPGIHYSRLPHHGAQYGRGGGGGHNGHHRNRNNNWNGGGGGNYRDRDNREHRDRDHRR